MHESTAVYRDPAAWDEFRAILNAVQLPSTVQHIADVIGREAALMLVKRLPRAYSKGHTAGQAMLYVPHRLPPGHRLIEILGEHDARKLSRVFAGEVMLLAACAEIQSAFRNHALRVEMMRGTKAREICRLFCLSPSRARGIKSQQGLGRGNHRRKSNINKA